MKQEIENSQKQKSENRFQKSKAMCQKKYIKKGQ